jgi:carbon-monoxide dehydrogenase small subunit
VLVDSLSEAGSVQCGFCTPGIVIAAEALLRSNPQPDVRDIREAISGNLCRCTGYSMIVEGIGIAASRGKGLW